jgi:hypothetical protein
MVSNTSDKEEVDRRSILKRLAGSSMALYGGVGIAGAKSDTDRTRKDQKMKKRFADRDEVVSVFEPSLPVLVETLQSEGKIPDSADTTVRGIVRSAEVYTYVVDTNSGPVTHIDLDHELFDVRLLHQLELERTLAYTETDTKTYSVSTDEDSVETLSCFYTDTICCDNNQSCFTSDNEEFDQSVEERCCCCTSTTTYCYWVAEDGDCCTEGENCTH